MSCRVTNFFSPSHPGLRDQCVLSFPHFSSLVFLILYHFLFSFVSWKWKRDSDVRRVFTFMEDEGDDDIVERLASAAKGDERRGVVVPSQGGWGVSRDEGVRSEAMRNSVNVYKGGWVERRRYYVGEYGEMEKREAAINTSTRRTTSITAVSVDGIGFMWGRGEVRWSRRVSGNQAWREWAEANRASKMNGFFLRSLARCTSIL